MSPVSRVWSSPRRGAWYFCLEKLSVKYDDQFHFIIIVYTNEAHPNYLADPETYKERIELSTRCVEKDDINVLVLVDEMDDYVWRTYGAVPNNAFLIDTDGTIVAAQVWYRLWRMEKAIVEYLEERKSVQES